MKTKSMAFTHGLYVYDSLDVPFALFPTESMANFAMRCWEMEYPGNTYCVKKLDKDVTYEVKYKKEIIVY